MDAERLIKMWKDNIPAGRWSPGRPKRRWSDLIAYNKEEDAEDEDEEEEEEENIRLEGDMLM